MKDSGKYNFIKRGISILMLLALMVVVVPQVQVIKAAGVEETAQDLEFGKKVEIYLTRDYGNNGDNDFSISIPSKGVLKVNLESNAERTNYALYDSNGNHVIPVSWKMTQGSILNYNGYLLKYFTWNSVIEKSKGTISYKLSEGTYFFRVSKGSYGGNNATISTSFKEDASKDAKSAVLSITLKKGQSLQLGAILEPIDSISKVTWKSSKTSVATVSSKGLIKAKSKGKTTITMKVNGITIKTMVKVK